MINYIAIIMFDICICRFVRLCEIFTSWRMQPQLAFEVMSYVHYKMAGHRWLLRLIWKVNCMMTAFRISCWGFIKRSAHFDCVHNWFVKLCRTFSAWWSQSRLVLTLCQMFAVRWLESQLICELTSNGHCMITAITDGLYRIGWSNYNTTEFYSGGTQM
jgi:hypothetical protein